MKSIFLYIMVSLYVVAGIKHFLNPDFFNTIMPPWLGWHQQLIYLSGACEILFGLLLIPVKTRRITAWCIIGLLIAVFPANIQMTMNYIHEDRPGLWLTILRLPLQVVLIWWAYLYTKPVAAGNNPQ